MPTYPIAASTKGLCKRTCSIALFSGTEIELGALFAVPLCRKPAHYPTGQPTADSVPLSNQILFPGPRRLVKYSVASPKVHIHPVKIYSVLQLQLVQGTPYQELQTKTLSKMEASPVYPGIFQQL
jgi:hypothetical protein